MGRGFISGIIWGSVVALVGLWLLSQIIGIVALLAPPSAQDVASVPVEVGAGDAGDSESSPVAPVERIAPRIDESARGGALAPAGDDPAPRADTGPASRPATANVPARASAPAVGDGETGGAVAALGGAGPAPGATVSEPAPPSAPPAGDALPKVNTAPPPAPLPGAAEALGRPGDSGSATGADGQAAPPASDQPAPAAPEPAAPAPVAPVDQVPPVTDFSAPQIVATPAPAPEPVPAPEPGTAATVEPRPADPSATAPAGSVPPPAPLEQPDPNAAAADAATDRQQARNTPRRIPILRKSGTAVAGTSAHFQSVGRGPAFGIGAASEADTAPDEAATGGAAAGDADPAADLADLPAIRRYAVPFENPENRPMMAIVLLPEPQGDGAPAQTLPFPVSYAVDGSAPDARARMAAYRAAGHEVVALAPLPEGSEPRDVEVAFESYFAAVPEAVAFLDTPRAQFQSSRRVAAQVAKALAAGGQGMITYSRGLNTGLQVAERERVPVALVFRVIDDAGRKSAAIKRFLDQAAFRAGQMSGVVLIAHDRPETRRALLEWSLGNRAGTVALAPVSAALLVQQP